MTKTVLIVVLLSVTLGCNGQLGILSDILGTAHKHVHDTVHGVANTVLGGFNVEFNAHTGVKQKPPQTPSGETIVVVVKEQGNINQRPPHPHHHNHYGQKPGYGHYPQNRPDINNYGQSNDNYGNQNYQDDGNQNYGRPPNNNYGRPEGNYGDFNQNNNNYGRPVQHHGRPGQHGYSYEHHGYGFSQSHYGSGQNNYGSGQNNYGRPEQNNEENEQGNFGQPNQNNVRPGQNNYDRPDQNNFRPGQHNQGNNQDNYGHPSQNNYGKPDQNPNGNAAEYTTLKPNQEQISTKPYNSDHKDEPSTNKPWGTIFEETSETTKAPEATTKFPTTEFPKSTTTTVKPDGPFLVPLNPNEYIYGGDKIEINAPKRETDEKKKDKEEDEDLPIDIRFIDE